MQFKKQRISSITNHQYFKELYSIHWAWLAVLLYSVWFGNTFTGNHDNPRAKIRVRAKTNVHFVSINVHRTNKQNSTVYNANKINTLSYVFFAEVEQVYDQHTSYEDLVTQQSEDIEHVMRKEVQRFYDSWSRKLENLKPSKLSEEEAIEEMENERKQRLSDNGLNEEQNFKTNYDEINEQAQRSLFSPSEI